MSVYMTEEEQLEAIKKWWGKHNTWIIYALSLILLCVGAYKYWTWHETKLSTQASNAYERMMQAFSNQDDKDIRAYANQLIRDYSSSVYAGAAYLSLAKLDVGTKDYDKAASELQWVIEHSSLKAFQEVARLRLAQLLLAKKDYTQALSQLDMFKDSIYLPLANELKGDLYLAMNKKTEAGLAYQEALAGMKDQNMNNSYLEMKISDLGLAEK